MPIYEYWCPNCRRKVTVFVQGFSSSAKASCEACGSENLIRLFSSFAMRKTDKDVYEDVLSDSRLVKGLMQNEPRALMEWSKKMGDALGQEASSEYKDMLKRLDKGEEIETAASDYVQKETEPKRPPPSS